MIHPTYPDWEKFHTAGCDSRFYAISGDRQRCSCGFGALIEAERAAEDENEGCEVLAKAGHPHILFGCQWNPLQGEPCGECAALQRQIEKYAIRVASQALEAQSSALRSLIQQWREEAAKVEARGEPSFSRGTDAVLWCVDQLEHLITGA